MANSTWAKIEVDTKTLRLLVSALKRESDGKELVKDLVRNLRTVAEPAAAAAKASILSMESHHESMPGLRASIARATKVSVRTTGKRAGVAIRTSKLGMPRGFRNAPKRLNSKKGWRHPVFGQDRWVSQVGKPGWFDDTIAAFKPAAHEAAKRALVEMANRIDRRTRG
jgi:hypothetical protein